MNTGQLRELDDYVWGPRGSPSRPGSADPALRGAQHARLLRFVTGKPDLADRFFDEAISIDVPDWTVSVNKPIEARAAFRQGNPSAAFRILRAYVHELLETDYPDLAANAAVEFINEMAIERVIRAP